MKKNKITLVIVTLLILAAIVILTTYRYGTLNERESIFSVQDTASVIRIFMADKQLNLVEIERKAPGWIVNGKYPASTKMLEMLLGTIKNLEIKSPVSIASRDNVIRRMAGIAVKVEIYQQSYRINFFNKIKLFQHEKLVKVFYVGDATPNNLGTYMLMEGASNPFVVHIPGFRGFLFTRFSPNPDDWKSHVVFNNKLIDIKEISVNFIEQPNESFSVKIVDSKGNYEIKRLVDGSSVENYDTLKVINFLTSFRDLRYESRLNNILAPVVIDSIINSTGFLEINLIDKKSDTAYVKFFKKKAIPESVLNEPGVLVTLDLDRAYALINKGEDFVLVQYYTFDKILHPLSYYTTN